jgi:hypothetical protein
MAADWETLETLGTEEEAELVCGYLETPTSSPST